MTNAEKKKLVAGNAAILAAGMLLSFILPMVAESITEGRGRFLMMLMHIFPLIVAMVFSTNIVSRAAGETGE